MNLTAHALLFDMDGTLVDSTVVVERTWHAFAERHGLDGDAVLASAHGRRTAETVAAHAPAGIDLQAETTRIEADEVLATDGVVAVAGAAELLAQIPAGGWALVTSASRALAESRMGAAGLAMPLEVISADDVRNGKPDPEGYLAAAERLGVDARQAIVLEDARAGIEAGLASGAQVLVIGAHAGPSADGLPRIPDFRGVSVEPAADGQLRLRRVGLPGNGGS